MIRMINLSLAIESSVIHKSWLRPSYRFDIRAECQLFVSCDYDLSSNCGLGQVTG